MKKNKMSAPGKKIKELKKRNDEIAKELAKLDRENPDW